MALLPGCASSLDGPGRLRFVNRPPVRLVNDRRPVPKPKKWDLGLVQYYFRVDFARPALGALKLERHRPAADVNSLGEVPESTWFADRLGRLTPDDVRRGPGHGTPAPGPLAVDGVKVGGAAIGFTVKDARGDKFIVKFDEREFPETETSADVIVQRLIWLFGYNVPENDVIERDCADLVLGKGATFEDLAGNERPMTQADLDRYLDLVRPASGHCRALASRFIGGVPVGGFLPHGTREGDPNDTVPHQHRRALRGQKMLFAWVDHVDLKPQNTFVAYDEEHHHLVHYLLDFGKSLGTWARIDGLIYMGHRTQWGFGAGLKSLLTLGIWVPPWERSIARPDIRGVGYFGAETFDPARWSPHHRWAPVDLADRFDDYWAGVRIMRITPAHVRAAVAAGRYTDPRAAAYVTRVLLERQRKIGRYVLSRVAPYEHFEAGARSLCFDDLWVAYRFGAPGETRYRAKTYDHAGRLLGTRAAHPRAGARVCLDQLTLGAAEGGYTIVRIAAERGGDEVPEIYVHLARDADGALRVIGLDRR
ncbi:MAG TPA: hypothetical protein VMZ28_27140 [Kofleriaceae bacterium]|nr:hypothetical protein [Kofleriaceae bacterium]